MAKSLTIESYIPDDLALSVLSKLPLKSLKRFGCVRKSWSVLFQNPNFMTVYRANFISNCRHSYYDDTSILMHQKHHSHDYSKVYCSLHSLSGVRFENRLKLEVPTPFQEEEDGQFYISGTGLFIGTLCLYIYNKIVLWNPTTDEFNVIPPSSIESVPNYTSSLVRLNGFGYDHVRDDYKIIRHIIFSPIPLWEMYSVRCNSWKKLDVNMPTCPFHADTRERLYLNGICHWWAETEIDEYNDEHYLVSFNLTNDEFFTTHVPLAILSNIDANLDLLSGHVVALNESVALISWYVASSTSFSDNTTFHISILGELGVTESWTKLFIVGPLPYIDNPIGAGKNGDIFFRNNNGELVCFDLSTQIIEELGVEGACFCNIVLYKRLEQ